MLGRLNFREVLKDSETLRVGGLSKNEVQWNIGIECSIFVEFRILVVYSTVKFQIYMFY